MAHKKVWAIAIAKAGAYFGAGGFGKTFELGLEMFLDEMGRLREAARNETLKK